MATNLRAPVTEDIWHLSIDDLLSPLPEKPRLGGAGPFVINLSSSTASIGLPTLNIAGCDAAHAYEIQRSEDGRTRYRLRLGPFETEDEAEVLLDMVREIYPSALTATAAADDLKAIASIRAKAAAAAEARRPPQPPKRPEPPTVTTRAEPAAAQPAAVVAKPAVPARAPVAAAPQPATAAAKPVAAPVVAPKPAPVSYNPAPVSTSPVASMPVAAQAPVAVAQDEGLSFEVDLSFADIISSTPEPPVVTVRAEPPLRAAVSKFVEPPLVTERAEIRKPIASPPVVTERATVAVAPKPKPAANTPAVTVHATPAATASLVLPPTAAVGVAPVLSTPSLVVAAPVLPATPVVVATPVVEAAPSRVITLTAATPAPTATATLPPAAAAAPAAVVWKPPAIVEPVNSIVAAPTAKSAPTPTAPPYVSPVKKPTSIWSSLPVAPRSVQKPHAGSATPSMSVSAPLVRRTAPGASTAAKAAAPAKTAAAPKAPAAAATPAAVAAPPPQKPATVTAKPAATPTLPKAALAQKPAAAAHHKHPAAPAKRAESHMSLDSTQTMRALTSLELEDEDALPWFVIELATAGEAFDPDTVPNLDIFAEYRLYSVADVRKNEIVHSLRVGFFSAEIAAKAVASYLAEYYEKSTVKRVSFAERERFAEQAVEARKDVGATGRHAVIEITDDLVARRKRSTSHSPSP
jgi:SPOR domain